MTDPSVGLLEARDLRVEFPGRRGQRVTVAVDGVDLRLGPGEALGLVGESGCGKTTVARVLAGLQAPTTGGVTLDGRTLGTRRTRAEHRAVQMVFQDPTLSLNPRLRVGAMLRQLLAVHFDRTGEEAQRRTRELMELVGLPGSTLARYPRQLSGGQRQRVAIARALAVEPRVVVADEPTSALDVSVQATILRLFADLRAELGVGLILISHNLAATRAVCDRVDVMYLGRIVEDGGREAVFARPAHPYTRALLASAPSLSADATGPPPDVALAGEPPSASHIPGGCRLHPRCPRVVEECRGTDPALEELAGDPGHRSACLRNDRVGAGVSITAPVAPAPEPRGRPT